MVLQYNFEYVVCFIFNPVLLNLYLHFQGKVHEEYEETF